MSKRRSARIAVWAAAGVVGAGAISLLALPATAATPTVTFTGGCGLLSLTSSSEPDKDSVTAQKTSSGGAADVVVVNDLGASAVPYANGSAVKYANGDTVVVGSGDSVTLPFASGPVELTLVPKCDGLVKLTSKNEATTVTVREAPESGDQSGGSGSDSGSGTDSGSKAGSGTDSGADKAAGGSDSTAADEAEKPKDPAARDAAPPAAGDEAAAGDDAAVGDDAEAPVAGDESDDADSEGAAAPMLPTNHDRGPGTTTLALVAAVCLLGVGAAALRTMVVARAVS